MRKEGALLVQRRCGNFVNFLNNCNLSASLLYLGELHAAVELRAFLTFYWGVLLSFVWIAIFEPVPAGNHFYLYYSIVSIGKGPN